MRPEEKFKLLVAAVDRSFDYGYGSWEEYDELLDFLYELKGKYNEGA